MKTVSSETFEEEVLRSETPVLVDFFATWCGPCKSMEPTLDRVDKETALEVIKVDVDENPNLAKHYLVTEIPHLALFVSGFPVGRLVGAKPYSEIIKAFHEYVCQHFTACEGICVLY